MDNVLCQRIKQLQEKAERVKRFLNAFNGFTRITETEIAARRVSPAGMNRLLPKQVIPITFLGITIGHDTVTVGNQQDAQDALKAKLSEIDEGDALQSVISFCREALARDSAVNLNIVETLDETCDRIEEKIKRESDRQRGLVNASCYPIPHINRNRRRY